MAAPTIRGVAAPVISNTGTATSPSATAVGDLVLIFVWSQAGAGIPTHTLQSGYREILSHSHNDGSTDGRLSVACVKATNGGAQSYTPYSISGATSNQTNAGIVVLEAGTWDEATLNTDCTPDPVPSASATTTGTGAPNPPAVTNVCGDVLAFAVGAWHVTSASSVTTTPPTSYTEQLDGPTGSHVTHLAVATRELTGQTIATVDPGAFADNVTPNGSARMTFAIRGASTWRHGLSRQLYGQGGRGVAPEGYINLTIETTDGATWIIGRGGMISDMATAPTDSEGNTFTLIGSTHEYTDWSGYGFSSWICTSGNGGAGHKFTCNVTLDDEHTLSVIEVPAGYEVEDSAHVQVANASGSTSHVSGDVTTAGAAILIAHWWGAGPVGSGDHIVTANNGFVLVDCWGVDDPNGYVQHYVFAKAVETGGTYNVTFTQSPSQGAQSLLLALSEPSSVSSADGAATGAATVTGSSSTLGTADGSTDGAGTGTGAATAIATADGASDGSASITGDAMSLGIATGAADGAGATSGSVSAVAAGTGASDGTASATGASSARANASGVAASGATASGAGVASAVADGDADGAGTAVGAGGAAGVATGSAAGAGTATGDADGGLPGNADGTSSGSANAAGEGTATAAATGSATAGASAAGASSTVAASAGSSPSSATVVGDARATAAAAGMMGGAGEATGHAIGIAAADGSVAGSAASSGDAVSLGIGTGTSAGGAGGAGASSAVAFASGASVGEASATGDVPASAASAPTIAVTFIGAIDVRWARDRVATIFVEDEDV